ncbi:MAG: YjfB family protein [Lachnospiraceae bacterium]|nr:YjfB family protein [Lachnospiraceae bacterium]
MNLGFADLSVSFNTQETLNAFSIKMLDKAMDTNEAIGQGIVEMIDSAAMERSVNPAVGSNFDMSV